MEASDDFVRLEIAVALKRGIPVVQLLLPNATRPDINNLPPDLKALAYRQAMDLRDETWEEDVGRLAEKIKPSLNLEEEPKPPPPWWTVFDSRRFYVVAVGIVIAFLFFKFMSDRMSQQRALEQMRDFEKRYRIDETIPFRMGEEKLQPTTTPSTAPTTIPEGPPSTVEGSTWIGESVVNSASVKYRIKFMKNDRVDWTFTESNSSETLIGNYTQSEDSVSMTFNKVKSEGRASGAVNMKIELIGTLTGDLIKGTGKNSNGFNWTWSAQKED